MDQMRVQQMTDPNLLAANERLRDLIVTAVDREIELHVAPMRQRVQYLEGQYRESLRLIGKQGEQIETLQAIVRGDSALGLSGLVETVQTLSTNVAALVKRIDTRDQAEKEEKQRLNDYLRAGKWVAGVLLALGVLDNTVIQSVISTILTRIP